MLSAMFKRSVGSVPWKVANDTGWGVWPGDGGPATTSGVHVDGGTATQLLAVYGSATFITDEIATLPVRIDDAPRPGWVDAPSEGLDRIAWLSQVLWSLLLSGNCYLAVMGNPMDPAALDPLDPSRVDVRREGGRKTVYINGQRPPFGVIHIPGRMRPGDLVGMSPVEWCRQTIGLGLAAQKYGAEFFSGEGNMPGVIEAPTVMQQDTMTNLAAQWRRKRSAGGRGTPGVLHAGATWKATGVTNEQAQFLKTRQHSAAEIAGQMFLMDPSDLGIPVDGTSLTYANLEQRNTRRLQVTLMPWIRRIESQLSMIIAAGEYRFDVDSRLRGNTRESYETLGVAIDNDLMTAEFASQSVLGLPSDARDGITEVSPPRKNATTPKGASNV